MSDHQAQMESAGFLFFWFLLEIVLNSGDLQKKKTIKYTWNVLNSTAKMYNEQTLGADSTWGSYMGNFLQIQILKTNKK